MPAFADDNGTVITGELAFATGAFEVYTADTARVVGFFGQIPLPGGYRSEGVDGDFHYDEERNRTDSVGVLADVVWREE